MPETAEKCHIRRGNSKKLLPEFRIERGLRCKGSHEDRGPQRLPDHSGYVHAPGSENAEGNSGRYGGRAQEGDHGSPEEPDAEAGQQGDSIPRDGQLRLVSRSFDFGAFIFGWNLGKGVPR